MLCLKFQPRREKNSSAAFFQGCQIFIDTKYQNGGKYTKLPQNYPMTIKNSE
jgi:hypothetical protein